ncbi:MAG: HD domain-containing protein [Clostridium sp.]|uniref:HD domain-containing protein n=1 Tax=Clostridium sp. DSM 8431 TaxID=1761781 RepID=UPI000B7FB92D|nr:HD domain-containing protein [Clostridium sp. DSM 8431]MCR4943632.1 HD domain-containing protein [Clostridium sp.]
MSLYRIKQFIWSITTPFKPIDLNTVNKYLDEDEIVFFKRMKKSEQHHCIRVCNDALKESKKLKHIDEKKIAKIALLHDIGKIEGNLTVIDKSILVILNKFTRGKLKRYTNNKKVDIYYNHPKKSVALLKSINTEYDFEFLEAIEEHHNVYDGQNKYIEIIKRCDDNN